MAIKEHNIEPGKSIFFKNSTELIEFVKTHKTLKSEFALQCGQGKDGNGYILLKPTKEKTNTNK